MNMLDEVYWCTCRYAAKFSHSLYRGLRETLHPRLNAFGRYAAEEADAT